MFDNEMNEGYRETMELVNRYKIPYSVARKIVTGDFTGPGSVLCDWVTNLPLMQQSVLIANVRNADGTPKFHKQKPLIRWFRRCVLKSAFDGRELKTHDEPGGGSFTGPVDNLAKALDDFIDSRDEMTLHYYAHAMHAFEIIGYKHPDPATRHFFRGAYERMAHTLHLWPETVEQMDRRLGDNETGWRERNDPSSTCSD